MSKPALLEVALWNCHNASPDRLGTVIGHVFKDADTIVVNEAWRRHGALKQIARGTLRDLHQEEPRGRGGSVVAEEGSTAVLTRKGTAKGRSKVIALAQHWIVYSANKVHDGRRLEKVTQIIDGQRFVTLGVHGPTKPRGGALNTLAQKAFLARCKVFLTMRRPGSVKLVVGDMNVDLGDAPQVGAEGHRHRGPPHRLLHRRGRQGQGRDAGTPRLRPPGRQVHGQGRP